MAENTNHNEGLQADLSRPSTPWEYLRLFLSGFAMGASDIVPGVSGGTMAFILGVYETLINGIKSFNLDALKLGLSYFNAKGQNKKPSLMEIADYIHLRFLIPLGLGLLIAVILLSGLLEGLIATQPTYIFAFFAGLIIASVIAIGYKVKWGLIPIITLIIGTIIAYIVTNPALSIGENFGHGPLVLFISGAIAICAMILPGISGSFILLVLGQYEYVLGAVKDRDIVSIIFVGLGAMVGILAFSRVLSWLLSKYEHPTIALLVGFMLGSMRLIYYRMTHLVDEETEIVTQLDLTSNQILIAVGFAIIGFVIVTALDHLQSRSNPLLVPFDKNAKSGN